MNPRSAVFVALTASAIAASCASSSTTGAPALTQEEVVRTSMTAYCTRYQLCDSAGFGAAYASLAACVDGAVGYMQTKRDLSAAGDCPKTQLDACTTDIYLYPCADMKTGRLPASCSTCGLTP